jgi:protein subunit release factor B
MAKELLFSLSKAKGDFIVQPFKGSGKGGQKRNKTMSACRIIHPGSGAVSECQEERSFYQNQSKAFKRLIEKPEFRTWYRVEVARQLGQLKEIDRQVENSMNSNNIRVEAVDENGRWTPCNI